MDLRARMTPRTTDVLVAVVLFGLALANLADADMVSSIYSREVGWGTIVVIAGQTLPLAVRRTWPRWVTTVVIGAFMVDRVLDYPSTIATAGVVVALHTVGSELRPRTSLRIGIGLVGGLTVFTALGAITLESVSFAAVATTFLFTGLPLFLGREVHARRLEVERLEDRAARAEREREEEAARAVAVERARIARELHDVVAHQLTVMTLQAEGARRIVGDDPRVADALATIGEAGHEGLSEMRRMVGLLRTESEEVALEPQPGLGSIDELVGHMRDAGLAADVRRLGTARDLAPGVDVNLYRIVQEALTNALRHGGPGVTATVTLHYGSDEVAVEVVDDGRGAASRVAVRTPQVLEASADSTASGQLASPGRAEGDGHGLVGMQERVALLGGSLRAGPRAGGGFAVRATIPVPS